MAKKTALKKSRRRLKRTVRRSIAAVLMVTAIAVAAIPVPENLADEPGNDTEGDAGIQYVDATKDVYVNNPGSTVNKYADYTDEELVDAVTGEYPDLEQTEIVVRDGQSLVLTWQFLYEPINTQFGRLCRYNNYFPREVVNLGLQPNKNYFVVKATEFNNYFGANGDPKSCGIDYMDNLKPSNMFYPTNTLTYSCSDYDQYSGAVTLDEKAVAFFQKYFERDFTTKTDEFKAYYEALKNNPSLQPPTALERRPADLDSDQQIEFFCEHNNILKGTKYRLTTATDQRLGQSNSELVYVAYSTEKSEDLPYGYVDVDGYLVLLDVRYISTIADKAFYNVQNVGQIDFSDKVQYIGEGAFENSGITSVVIGNADMIGNRAFYGCQKLTEIKFTETADTYAIGAEAFRMSGINTTLVLPWTLKEIGYGAFSSCLSLTEVRFDDRISDCVIGDYAFFDDTRLTTVNFGTAKIKNMGKGCFAVQSPSGDSMQNFSFPGEGLGNMDDYVLANHRNLTEVNIQNYTKKIPESTFYNCFGLKKAVFSEKCGTASFDTGLFRYVTDPEFCVYGPELYADGPAYPRSSTWDAVRNDGVGIPYVYESGGKTYYEMALESEDGTRYRYGAGNDGELISCALIDSNAKFVDIVIPSKIGNFDIKSIGSECFSNKELRQKIRSITIQNRSVSTIADGAFRDLPMLTKVRIGDSVTNIGREAFAGCKKLYDVFFTKPSTGYESLVMDDSAFVTTGSQLTFHGDIAEGYAPFEWATDVTHVLKDQDNVNVPAINVCYQSLWDSEVGTHLTVMCDKTGEVTLLDYPKYSDLDVTSRDDLDEELRDYCADMENYYYYTVYDSGDAVEQMRQEYSYLWDAVQRNKDSVVLPNGQAISSGDFEAELAKRYGPWINPNYCEPGFWKSYLPSGGDTAKAGLADWLFEPIVAEAAVNPTPYFKTNPYNFMKNYQSYLNDPAYESYPDYMKVPDKVWTFINATQEIVVPAGVDSIDVSAYAKANGDNYDTYIRKKRPSATNNMYTRMTNGATPGLFSGYYVDYKEGDQREENANGNDHIRSIILTSVKKLPDYAFDSCEQLERVVLGNIEKIGALPFRGCGNLTNVVGNEKYPAENGILYAQDENNAGKYKIVECLMTRGKPNTGDENLEKASIAAPEPDRLISSVIAISESAFEGCDGISVVDLSTAEGLEIIPENCFKDCKSLINVKLPRTVTKIRDDAFGGIADATHPLAITIPGREVDIADMAFDPKRNVTIYTYEDSAAYRYGKRYEGQGMKVEVLNAFRVMFYDYDGAQVGATQIVDHDTGGSKATAPPEEAILKEAGHRPGYSFSHWETTGGKTLDDPITEDMTVFIAQYESDGSMVNGKYVVEFLDGIDGHTLSGRNSSDTDGKYYVPPYIDDDPANASSFAALGWEAPTPADHSKEGKEFLQWSNGWTENTTIDSNMTIIALYRDVTTSGGSTNTSGGSTNTSRGSTSGGSSNTSRGSSNSSSNNSSSSSSSSTSTTSSTSNTSSSTAATYTVTVVNGSGSGTYAQGSTVVIAANEPAAGMVFQKWTTESNGVTLASVSMTATTFTMPAGNVTVTANYVAAPTPAANTGNNDNNGGGGSTGGNGSTRVDITKPGISNKDLANANANGTTDNFIVKITETDEATRAVADALTNKYGSLDNILYYAMDISLWDSTGSYQLTSDQLAGITVDITIPIPDALVAYGGNNMAGAVVNGNQLENLNENFTTINGVPCIRFTASHFSPYTVYVDTGNLTAGMLDTTPKTGDPIHPKWFLSIGLACLSVILFMKKDKAVKVKTT